MQRDLLPETPRRARKNVPCRSFVTVMSEHSVRVSLRIVPVSCRITLKFGVLKELQNGVSSLMHHFFVSC